MIENVEELIEVYSLDKEIEKTHPVYRNYAIQLFTIYNLINLRIRLLPIPKDEVKPNNENTVGSKPVRNESADKPANLPKSANNDKKAVMNVNKAPAEKNTNSGNGNTSENSTTNNKINERTATINIVQNAYANGRSDDDDDTGSNGCSAINNINISFGNND